MALEVIARGQRYITHRGPAWAPGRHVTVLTLHDQHFESGDGVYDKPVVESYGALTADADGYTAGADQMRHALKVDDLGNRLWLPRRNVDSQSIRFGRPRYSLDPLVPTPTWTNIPLGAPTRQGGLVKWTRPLYEIGAWITWRKIGLGWRILDRLGSDIVGLQIPVTLTGLQFDADTFQLKSAGLVLATVNVSDAIDATGKTFPVTRRLNGGAIEYVMDLTGATYPVTVTPLNDTLAVTSGTGDGHINGGNSDYATARADSTGLVTNQNYVYVGQNKSGVNFYPNRAFLRFDTSSIPDDNTVSQVNLDLTPVIADNSATDFDVQIVSQDWSAQDPLDATNREAAYDGCLAGATEAVWRNTSGMSLDTTYTSPNLSTARVNKAGYTYYSLRSSRDYSANEPTGAEYIQIASADHATAAYRPTLTVVHAAGAPTVVASRRSLLGVGV